MGSSMTKNTSGDQSSNKKANDKIVAQKNSEQLSSSASNTNNKISDDSSDSSLDYGSANEDNSSRDDISSISSNKININTQSVADSLSEEIHSLGVNIDHQPLKTKIRQKIYNELTESFETPDSSILDTSNESENCEIGEDPLNCTTDVQIRLLENNHHKDQLSNINTVRGCEDHFPLDSTLTLPLTDNSFSKDLEVDDCVKYERNLERESSIEVILKEVTERNEFDIQQSIQANINDVLNNVNVTDVLNPITGLYDNNYYDDLKTEFGDNIEEDFDFDLENVSNERRDSGASILVIHSDGVVDSNVPESNINEHKVVNETSNLEKDETSTMELSDVKNNNIESIIQNIEVKSEDIEKNVLPIEELDIQNECLRDMADGYKSSALFNGDSIESKIESKDEIISDLKKSILVETKEFLAQEIENDILPPQNVFYEPMDCDDSFAVTQSKLPNNDIMVQQENLNVDFNDIENPFVTKTKIQNSFDITLDEPMEVDMEVSLIKDNNMNETFDVLLPQNENVNIPASIKEDVDTVDTELQNQDLNINSVPIAVESSDLKNVTIEDEKLIENAGVIELSLSESLDKTVSFTEIAKKEDNTLNDTQTIKNTISNDSVENTNKQETISETEDPFETKCCLQDSVECKTLNGVLSSYKVDEKSFETEQSIYSIKQNASNDMVMEELQYPFEIKQCLQNSINSVTFSPDVDNASDVSVKEELFNPFETKQVLSNSIDFTATPLAQNNIELVSNEFISKELNNQIETNQSSQNSMGAAMLNKQNVENASDVLINEELQNPFETKQSLRNSIDFNAATPIQQNIENASDDLKNKGLQNPFETKQSLRNSVDFNAALPIQQNIENASDDLRNEELENPFETKQSLRNSIDFNAALPIEQNIENSSDDLRNEELQNPFETKQSLRNSMDFNAALSIQQNIENASDDLRNEELQNPFETKQSLRNSIDFNAALPIQQNIENASDDLKNEGLQNPFETKQSLRNSVDFNAALPIQQNIENASDDLRNEELQNPFETKQSLRNSIDFNAAPPIQQIIESASDDLRNEELENPFETKQSLRNSINFNAALPIQQNIENASDVLRNEELQNPFETKESLRNSLDFDGELQIQQNVEDVSDNLISEELQNPFETKQFLRDSIDYNTTPQIQQNIEDVSDDLISEELQNSFEKKISSRNSIERDAPVVATDTYEELKNVNDEMELSTQLLNIIKKDINETFAESELKGLTSKNVQNEIEISTITHASVEVENLPKVNENKTDENETPVGTKISLKTTMVESIVCDKIDNSDSSTNNTAVEVKYISEEKSTEKLLPHSDVLLESDENPFETKRFIRNSLDRETFVADDIPNPFTSKKALRNSLDRDIPLSMNIENDDRSDENIVNPFKTRRSLHRSPDRSINDEVKEPSNVEETSKTENKEVDTPYPKLKRSTILTTDSTNDSYTILNNDLNTSDSVDKIVIEKTSAGNTPDSDNSPASSNSDSTIRGKYYPSVETTPEKEIEPAKSSSEEPQNNPFSPMVRPEIWMQDKRMATRLSNILNLSPMSKCGDLMGMSPTLPSRKNEALSANVEMDENDLLTGQSFPADIADVGLNIDDDEGFTSPEELFKDPAAFDFLLNCGNSTTGPNSVAPTRDFGKESLFVKFDPLVSRLPQGVRPGRETDSRSRIEELSISKVSEDVSTSSGLAESCSSDSSITLSAEQGKASGTMSSVEQSLGLLSLQSQTTQPLIASVPAIPQSVANLQMSEKPTQVVSPAKNARQYQPCTPTPPSKVSTPASPAIAAIDRLINLGLNTPPPPPPVIQPKEPEMDPQLLKELQSVKELWGNQEQELHKSKEMVSSLQQQLAESTEREQALIERVNEKNKNHRQMSVVMEEYERTMSQLIGEREVEKRQWLEERATLIRERDEASSHLANIEHSFNDIHAKYERCKTVIHTYKTNEEILKQTLLRNEDNLKKQTERYEQLRQHAMSQLDKASQEIDAVRKSSQAEIIKYQAMLKKSEIQITSLQESLAQKTKNCEELTSICDELINKVG